VGDRARQCATPWVRDDDVDTTRVSKGLHLGCNRVFRRRHVRVRGEARRGDDATRVTMMALMATRGAREGFDVMHAREVHARDGMNGC